MTDVRLTDDIICFTDGSKHPGLGQTGASIFNRTTNQVYMFPLGTYTTVFQAEVYAICACAKILLMESEATIAICSDSQLALMALRSSKVTSSLVAETMRALEKLSMLTVYVYFRFPVILTYWVMRQLTSLLNRQRVKISLDGSLHWVYLQRRFAVQLDYGPMYNSVSSGKPLVAVGRQRCSYTDQIKSFSTMLRVFQDES